MQLKVEFLGLARELAGVTEGLVTVNDTATWRHLLGGLADQYPALLGPVIIPESHTLTVAYMLNVGGRTIVRDFDAPVQPGQRLLLMFSEAGG
ncbi:MAG: hypothetical protein R6X16_15205 [Anaerolineae bacterium]